MNADEVTQAALRFYQALEDIGEEHEEVTEIDVREAIHDCLNLHFIWGHSWESLPVNYEMFSPEGDAAVAEAVESFLTDAVPAVEKNDIPVGRPRLALLQDTSLRTRGGSRYDLFIGHVEKPLSASPLHVSRYRRGDYE